MPGAGVRQEDQARFLCWNHVGSVGMRYEDKYAVLDIEFADKQNNKDTTIPDLINTEMACLAHSGVFMASKAQKLEIDEYEEEEEEEHRANSRYISTIKFSPFQAWKNIKEWQFDLPRGESADAIAIGNDWCAVATDSNYPVSYTHLTLPTTPYV